MINLILCEGKTDAVIIGYYLMKTANYAYLKKPKLALPTKNEGNEICSWFENPSNTLAIWGVGGYSNINPKLTEVIELNKIDFSINKIVIIRDRDDKTDDEILTEIAQTLHIGHGTLANNVWSDFTLIDRFKKEQTYSFLPLIIPFDEAGALETFLMNSISENAAHKYIVDESKDFVDGLNPIDSLTTDRLKLKAKLSVSFSLMSPDKVFHLLDEILKGIEWEKYAEVQTCFKLLGDLNK